MDVKDVAKLGEEWVTATRRDLASALLALRIPSRLRSPDGEWDQDEERYDMRCLRSGLAWMLSGYLSVAYVMGYDREEALDEDEHGDLTYAATLERGAWIDKIVSRTEEAAERLDEMVLFGDLDRDGKRLARKLRHRLPRVVDGATRARGRWAEWSV